MGPKLNDIIWMRYSTMNLSGKLKHMTMMIWSRKDNDREVAWVTRSRHILHTHTCTIYINLFVIIDHSSPSSINCKVHIFRI